MKLTRDELADVLSGHRAEIVEADEWRPLAEHILALHLIGNQVGRKGELRPFNTWPDPDTVGESAYRALHELAKDVIDSEAGEGSADTISILTAELENVREWCTHLLGEDSNG